MSAHRRWCANESNDYSVPTEYGHRQVLVKAFVWEVVIGCSSEVIARHERSYERESAVFDPLHYLRLLEQKSRALEQAAPLAGWPLPEGFEHLRRLLEVRLNKHGRREYIQVLRLLETFALNEVSGAVEDALRMNTLSFDAVRHLLLCRIERRPPRLDLQNWPHLPLPRARPRGCGLHDLARRYAHIAVSFEHGGGVMNDTPEMPTPDTPQVLLEHHLKNFGCPPS